MKGVTLLETMVVIAIIAVLSLYSINNINSFRNDAVLDNTSTELVSELRFARSKSMNGELKENENEEEFDVDGLPEYGVSIHSDKYELVRKCLKLDADTCSGEAPVEATVIDPSYSISPEGTVYFQRITGETPEKNLIVSYKGVPKRQITISKGLLITITKI